MYAAYCVLAFVVVLGFTLIVCGWIENRAERDIADLCPHCNRFTGRASTCGTLATSASALRAGARRGAPEGSGAEVVPFVRRTPDAPRLGVRSDELHRREAIAPRLRIVPTVTPPAGTMRLLAPQRDSRSGSTRSGVSNTSVGVNPDAVAVD